MYYLCIHATYEIILSQIVSFSSGSHATVCPLSFSVFTFLTYIINNTFVFFFFFFSSKNKTVFNFFGNIMQYAINDLWKYYYYNLLPILPLQLVAAHQQEPL